MKLDRCAIQKRRLQKEIKKLKKDLAWTKEVLADYKDRAYEG